MLTSAFHFEIEEPSLYGNRRNSPLQEDDLRDGINRIWVTQDDEANRLWMEQQPDKKVLALNTADDVCHWMRTAPQFTRERLLALLCARLSGPQTNLWYFGEARNTVLRGLAQTGKLKVDSIATDGYYDLFAARIPPAVIDASTCWIHIAREDGPTLFVCRKGTDIDRDLFSLQSVIRNQERENAVRSGRAVLKRFYYRKSLSEILDESPLCVLPDDPHFMSASVQTKMIPIRTVANHLYDIALSLNCSAVIADPQSDSYDSNGHAWHQSL